MNGMDESALEDILIRLTDRFAKAIKTSSENDENQIVNAINSLKMATQQASGKPSEDTKKITESIDALKDEFLRASRETLKSSIEYQKKAEGEKSRDHSTTDLSLAMLGTRGLHGRLTRVAETALHLDGSFITLATAVGLNYGLFFTLSKAIDRAIGSYRDLSAVGQGFTADLTELAITASMSENDLKEFTRSVVRSSKVVSEIGEQTFAEISKETRKLLEPYGQLGYSVSQVNDALGDYLEIQRLSGNLDRLNQVNEQARIAEFLVNISAISRATGIARDEILQNFKDAQTAPDRALWLSAQPQAVKDSVEAISSIFSAITGPAKDEFQDSLTRALVMPGLEMQNEMFNAVRLYAPQFEGEWRALIEEARVGVTNEEEKLALENKAKELLRKTSESFEEQGVILTQQAIAGNELAKKVAQFAAGTKQFNDNVEAGSDIKMTPFQQAIHNFEQNMTQLTTALSGAFNSLIGSIMGDEEGPGTGVAGFVTRMSTSVEALSRIIRDLTELKVPELETLKEFGRGLAELGAIGALLLLFRKQIGRLLVFLSRRIPGAGLIAGVVSKFRRGGGQARPKSADPKNRMDAKNMAGENVRERGNTARPKPATNNVPDGDGKQPRQRRARGVIGRAVTAGALYAGADSMFGGQMFGDTPTDEDNTITTDNAITATMDTAIGAELGWLAGKGAGFGTGLLPFAPAGAIAAAAPVLGAFGGAAYMYSNSEHFRKTEAERLKRAEQRKRLGALEWSNTDASRLHTSDYMQPFRTSFDDEDDVSRAIPQEVDLEYIEGKMVDTVTNVMTSAENYIEARLMDMKEIGVISPYLPVITPETISATATDTGTTIVDSVTDYVEAKLMDMKEIGVISPYLPVITPENINAKAVDTSTSIVDSVTDYVESKLVDLKEHGIISPYMAVATTPENINAKAVDTSASIVDSVTDYVEAKLMDMKEVGIISPYMATVPTTDIKITEDKYNVTNIIRALNTQTDSLTDELKKIRESAEQEGGETETYSPALQTLQRKQRENQDSMTEEISRGFTGLMSMMSEKFDNLITETVRNGRKVDDLSNASP